MQRTAPSLTDEPLADHADLARGDVHCDGQAIGAEAPGVLGQELFDGAPARIHAVA